jgi:hypothetical protein
MDGSTFDRLTKLLSRLSRRDVARAIVFAATAVPLTPVRIARAELPGVVVLGGECSTSTVCRQQDMQAESVCADNGFTADGALNCCVESGCCVSDVDCCGDLRCAPTGDVCSVCLQPPFPTRGIGQICASDDECVHSVVCEVGCLDARCVCQDDPDAVSAVDLGQIPPIPDSVTALAAAEDLSRLEVTGQAAELYALLHPDAREIIPESAIAGWYESEFPHAGEPAAKAVKVRFTSWTWAVNGKTYPVTAEVALRQHLADGAVVRDEVRLVKDGAGVWRWFFGRDRDFVEEQIARFGFG